MSEIHYRLLKSQYSFCTDAEQYSMALSQKGNILATGGIDDATCSLWNLENQCLSYSWLTRPLHLHGRDPNRLESLAFSYDDQFLVTGGSFIRSWNLQTRQLCRTFKTGGWGFYVALSHQKKILATLDPGGLKVIWDLTNGKKIRRRYSDTGTVRSLCINGDDTEIVGGDFDQEVKVWGLEKGNLLRVMESGGATKVRNVALSQNSKILIGYGFHGMQIWDYLTGERLRAINKFDYEKKYYEHLDAVFHAEISPDSNFVISCGRDGQLQVWRISDGTHYMTIETKKPVSDFRFNMDHSVLVVRDDSRREFEVFKYLGC